MHALQEVTKTTAVLVYQGSINDDTLTNPSDVCVNLHTNAQRHLNRVLGPLNSLLSNLLDCLKVHLRGITGCLSPTRNVMVMLGLSKHTTVSSFNQKTEDQITYNINFISSGGSSECMMFQLPPGACHYPIMITFKHPAVSLCYY